ncbi:hypothetical protein SH528x_000890 [Novipirellula sp. SH528]|uniref:hypothetical protein n=1 Tax=Novipirellula sp. SH528 TaxID=3454466 RepID=UPI003F9F6437
MMTLHSFRLRVLSTTCTLALLICWVSSSQAQISYPFEVPAGINATLKVDTKTKTPINSMLLGLNCNWPEGLYGKTGYNHPDAQRLIRTLKPSSLRFPHGVWSNFYDWESDGRRMTDSYKTLYDSAVKDHPDLKYGFDGLHTLHQELGFDVLFTWNVNYDSPEKGMRRLLDRRSKGFDVKWIELGNEIFWKTQRSEAVSDIDKYIAVSKAHAAAICAVAPEVQISVPVHWRNPLTDPWNTALMKCDHYDAITVHKHMSHQADREGAVQTLTARETMVEMAQTLRSAFPDKPLWISEWSVSCGDNAISILGMADTYLGFFEHPELFGIADYFQINASHALITYDKKTRTHHRTSYGAAYEIIRDVFENAERFASETDSSEIGDGIDAVSAEAVIKEGKLIVFTINKSTRATPFQLIIDGVTQTKPVELKTLSFENLNELKTFEMDESVLTNVKPDPSGIVLPPLSISRIDVALI